VYGGRITQVQVRSLDDLLNDPLYASLAKRRAATGDAEFDALVSGFLSGPVPVFCSTPADPDAGQCPELATNIDAIVDRRLLNLAETRTDGIDFSIEKRADTAAGVFDVDFNASYMFKLDRQILPLSATNDISNTVGNPVRLKMRATTGWRRNGWNAAVTVNHTGSYRDDISSPATDIASWTTFDLLLGYASPSLARGAWLDGLQIFINAHNVLDKTPPHFSSQLIGLGYDPINAEALGRALSLSLTKAW
jgi:outer membrane receptor protein involved in Fe transport